MANHEPSLDELFVRFRNQGDRLALADFYVRAAPHLRYIASRIVRDRGTAEDAVQSTFLLAIEKHGTFDARRPVLPWLTTILRNELRRIRRRRDPVSTTGDPVCTSGDAERAAMAAEWASRLCLALQSLPIPQQEVLVLHLREGLTTRQIARRLGRAETAVRSQLYRGRVRLLAVLPPALAALLLTRATGAAAPPCKARHRNGVGKALAATLVTAAVLVVPAGSFDASLAPARESRAAEVRERAGASGDPAPLRLPAWPAATAGAVLADVWQVRVVDEAGAPLAGARLRVRPAGGRDPLLHEEWLTADDAGVCRALPCPGDVDVEADRGGSTRLPGAACTLPHRLVVPAGYTIRGRVEQRGQPAAKATIWLSQPDNDREGCDVVTADADGSFVLAPVTGRRYLAARSADASTSTLVEVVARREAVIAPILELDAGAATVEGCVLDAWGSPVARALVTIVNVPPCPAQAGPVLQCWCDRDGRFRVTGVVAGAASCAAQAPGRVPATVAVAIVEGGRHEVCIRLGIGAAIAGCVRDGAGRPLSGVWVGPRHGFKERLFGAFTDAAGSFVVDGLPTTAGLWVDAGEHGVASQQWTALTPGSRVAWFPQLVQTRNALVGTLVDPAGRPLAGWSVIACSTGMRADEPCQRRSARTDTAGRFRFEACAGGDWALVARDEGEIWIPGQVHFVRADWKHLRLVVDTGAPRWLLRGRVVDERGEGVPRAAVTLWRMDRLERAPIDVDEAGRFCANDLPPGRFALAIQARQLAPWFREDIDPVACAGELGDLVLVGAR